MRPACVRRTNTRHGSQSSLRSSALCKRINNKNVIQCHYSKEMKNSKYCPADAQAGKTKKAHCKPSSSKDISKEFANMVLKYSGIDVENDISEQELKSHSRSRKLADSSVHSVGDPVSKKGEHAQAASTSSPTLSKSYNLKDKVTEQSPDEDEMKKKACALDLTTLEVIGEESTSRGGIGVTKINIDDLAPSTSTRGIAHFLMQPRVLQPAGDSNNNHQGSAPNSAGECSSALSFESEDEGCHLDAEDEPSETKSERELRRKKWETEHIPDEYHGLLALDEAMGESLYLHDCDGTGTRL